SARSSGTTSANPSPIAATCSAMPSRNSSAHRTINSDPRVRVDTRRVSRTPIPHDRAADGRCETTTGNRGHLVSNKRESPTNTGRASLTGVTRGSQDPIEYPIDSVRERLRKPENPDAIGVSEWRDPDSNRGHHD